MKKKKRKLTSSELIDVTLTMKRTVTLGKSLRDKAPCTHPMPRLISLLINVKCIKRVIEAFVFEFPYIIKIHLVFVLLSELQDRNSRKSMTVYVIY